MISKFDWLIEPNIITPDIDDDIKNFLGDDVLEQWERLEPSNKLYNTIIVITERLEFIEHLTCISEFFEDKTTTNSIKNKNKNVTTFHCTINNHDFAGVQFDINALNFYLYLTCIDALQQICKKNKSGGNLLTKNFIKAFTEEISSELQKTIIDNIIIINKNLKDFNNSLLKWDKLNNDKKLNKIGKYLYKIRSEFTHCNIRNFYPSVELASLIDENNNILTDKNEILLVNKRKNISSILKDVIIELCIHKLSNEIIK